VNSEGFTYADDQFRGTNNPTYASGNYDSAGGFSGGGLRVTVGDVNTSSIFNGMSGGWSKSFVSSGDVTVTLRYRLIFPGTYEPEECGQVLVSIDGTILGSGPNGSVLLNGSVLQFCGTGVLQDSGWQQFTFDRSLPSGTHTITVGGWNNQKTQKNEVMDVFFDDIKLETE
jgi:hypothetical protein